MLKEGIGGFCMALADSVPGVSEISVLLSGEIGRWMGDRNGFVWWGLRLL